MSEIKIISRSGASIGGRDHYVFEDENGQEWTLCEQRLFSTDRRIRLVDQKEKVVKSINCPLCNEVLRMTGVEYRLAKVKKKEEKGGYIRRKGTVPRFMTRYVCLDCGQTVTMSDSQPAPQKCFSCKSVDIVNENDTATVTRRSTDNIKRDTVQPGDAFLNESWRHISDPGATD